MADDTVSNHKRTVATKATKHKPTAVVPDMCKLPNNVPTPFPNWVTMDKLQNATVNTKIGDVPIWIKTAQVGPESEPHHAGTNKGVTSQTYCAEAVATSYSPDVIAENAEVVRTNDFTTQNHGNTTGIVDGTALGEALPNQNTYQMMRCAIVSLTGKSGDRPLGFPGREKGDEAYYLEVLEGDTVEFESTRADLTKAPPAIDPACKLGGQHTAWRWRRTGGGNPPEDQGPFVGKKYTLSTNTLATYLAGKSSGPGGAGTMGLSKPSSAEATFYEEKGSKVQTSDKKELTTGAVTGKVSGIGGSLIGFVNYWQFRISPTQYEVWAAACSGSKKAIIKPFPTPGINLTVSVGETTGEAHQEGKQPDPIVDQLKGTIKNVTSIFDAFKKVASIAGRDFEFVWFRGASLGGSIEYVACKEDKEGLYGTWYSKAHVGRKWTIHFGSSPLLSLTLSWPISLLNLVGPAVGEVAATGLRKIGVALDLIFALTISLSVDFSVGQDEYDFWTETGETTTLSLTPSAELVARVGIKLVSLAASFPNTFTIKYAGGDKKGVLLQLTITGSIKSVFTLTIFKDTWIEHNWTGEPDWGKKDWLSEKYDLITMSS